MKQKVILLGLKFIQKKYDKKTDNYVLSHQVTNGSSDQEDCYYQVDLEGDDS